MKKHITVALIFLIGSALYAMDQEERQVKKRKVEAKSSQENVQALTVLDQLLPSVLVQIVYEYSLPEYWKTIQTGALVEKLQISDQKNRLSVCHMGEYCQYDIVHDNKMLSFKHPSNLNGCTPSYDGSKIFFSRGRTNDLWIGYCQKNESQLFNDHYDFFKYTVSLTGQHLAASCKNKENPEQEGLGIFDVSSGILKVFKSMALCCPIIVFSHDEKTIACSNTRKDILLFDHALKQQLQELKGHEDRISDLCFSSNDQCLLSSSWDCNACLWSCASGALIKKYQHPDWVRCGALSDAWIVTTCRDGSMRFIDRESGDILYQTSGVQNSDSSSLRRLDKIAVSHDGSIVAASDVGRVEVFINPIEYLKHTAHVLPK